MAVPPPRVQHPRTRLVPTSVQPVRFGARKAAAYARALRALEAARVDFLVGGTVALNHYTGIWRETKDLDLFVRRRDLEPTLTVLRGAGFATADQDPAWLSKAWVGETFLDIIHANANGRGSVDEAWFDHATETEVLGIPARIVPLEEQLLSKVFVATRDRWDGADVLHIIFAAADRIDWTRLLARAGDDWELLLAVLVLFTYVYPGHRTRVPAWVMQDLLDRLRGALAQGDDPTLVFRGTLLDPVSFRVDVEAWGLPDVRGAPPPPEDGEEPHGA